jgi:hypothetical protein
MTSRTLSAEHRSVRDTLIQAAVDAGKFPESRAAYWRNQFDANPEDTKHWLARLQPVPDLAAAPPRTPAAEPEPATYDQAWLAPTERQRITAAQSGDRPPLATHARD